MTSYKILQKDGRHEPPQNERFSVYDPETNRTLIYTEAEKVKGYRALPAGEKLSNVEQKWLTECSLAVDREIFLENEKAFTDYLDDLFFRFEQNLKKAAEDAQK